MHAWWCYFYIHRMLILKTSYPIFYTKFTNSVICVQTASAVYIYLCIELLRSQVQDLV